MFILPGDSFVLFLGLQDLFLSMLLVKLQNDECLMHAVLTSEYHIIFVTKF